MDSDDIKEGFICPMCMKDLGNASVLQKHFEEVHSDDKDTLRQIRRMFGKAKRKIMDKIKSSEADGAISETVDGALEGPLNRGVDPFLWDSQVRKTSNSFALIILNIIFMLLDWLSLSEEKVFIEVLFIVCHDRIFIQL